MTDQIRARIETRLREIEQQLSGLQDALAALDSGEPRPRSATPAAGTGRPARPRRQRPTSPKQVLASGALERMLAESPGQSTTALASQANADPAQVMTLLKELEAAGSVRREGQGRGTRWLPYTDEDRIAERAAELEAQSRAGKAQREAKGRQSDGDGSGPSRVARRVAGLLTGR